MESLKCINTFSLHLDCLINGGIFTKNITYLCGESASGKTQLCLQIAVGAQLPTNFNGLGGQVIYLNCSNNFPVNRLEEIAIGTVEHLKRLADTLKDPNLYETLESFNSTSILQNIFIRNVDSQLELFEDIENIEKMVQQDKNNIKCIIIDDIARLFHYLPASDFKLENIYKILRYLQLVAYEYDIAVIFTITSLQKDDENVRYCQINQALTQSCSYKIMLKHVYDTTFQAELMKAPYFHCYDIRTVRFLVLNEGIRSLKME